MKIIESNSDIKLKMYQEIAKELDKKITKNRNIILNDIRNVVKIQLLSSATYYSLVDGELNSHFGFVEGTAFSKVTNIIEYVVSRINLRHTTSKASINNISSGLQVNLYRGSEEIINLDSAYIDTDDFQIPWLKWLLQAGDQILVSGFSIFLQDGIGRSGGALMIKNDAESWRVPPEYAGTERDNWLTRILSSNTLQNNIELILKKYI